MSALHLLHFTKVGSFILQLALLLSLLLLEDLFLGHIDICYTSLSVLTYLLWQPFVDQQGFVHKISNSLDLLLKAVASSGI